VNSPEYELARRQMHKEDDAEKKDIEDRKTSEAMTGCLVFVVMVVASVMLIVFFGK
jgi:hypothetical protein